MVYDFDLNDGTLVVHTRCRKPGGPACNSTIMGPVRTWISVGGGTYQKSWIAQSRMISTYKDLNKRDFKEFMLAETYTGLVLVNDVMNWGRMILRR